MQSRETLGSLKRFRRTSWKFQATFETPAKDLPGFVSVVLSANESLREGVVITDNIIFEPRNMNALLKAHSLPSLQKHDWSVVADSRQETANILEAALGDGLEFIFVPTPKPFVIYADHDEFITFYANTKSNLNSVADLLASRGYKKVDWYSREL